MCEYCPGEEVDELLDPTEPRDRSQRHQLGECGPGRENTTLNMGNIPQHVRAYRNFRTDLFFRLRERRASYDGLEQVHPAMKKLFYPDQPVENPLFDLRKPMQETFDFPAALPPSQIFPMAQA